MADDTDNAPAPKTKKLPAAIILQEPIGWMRGDSLVQFHDGDTITNPDDIADLVAHGALFWEIK